MRVSSGICSASETLYTGPTSQRLDETVNDTTKTIPLE